MLKKFPHTESVIKELSFLDALNHSNSSCSEIMSLASRFTSFTDDEHDNLSMEFRDFRSCSDSELPQFNSTDYAAIEHYWDAMSKVKLVTDINTSRFGTLALYIQMQILRGYLAWYEK